MQTIPGGIFILFFKASLGRVRARLIASFCFSAFVIWISFPTAVLADGPTATATPVAAQTSQANTNTNASDSSAGKTISSAPVVTATPAPAQNATTTLANATPDSKSTDASTTTSSAKETKSAVSSPTSTSSPTQNSNQNKIQTTATSVASPSPQPTQTAAKTSAPISTQNEVANPKRDAVPDPYITFDGVTYRFLSDCTGFSNCTQSTTPIQAAVNYFAQNSSVIAANDRTIFVDGGTYKENISINGINALAVRGSVNGARSVIDGSVTIANSVGINLLQFTVTRGIQVAASKDVTLSNVVAQNSGGNPALSISKSN
ncbi:MAG: hypothetical protein HY070_05350, partial [Chloroflexi bacterium]|nr:hypothetical protein [Chloroflexota bacterium]